MQDAGWLASRHEIMHTKCVLLLVLGSELKECRHMLQLQQQLACKLNVADSKSKMLPA
jgi:hypothetical protein